VAKDAKRLQTGREITLPSDAAGRLLTGGIAVANSDTVNRDDLLAAVKAFYFNSHEFNGYPVYRLKEDFTASDDEAKAAIQGLVSDGSIDIVTTGNPHIRPFNSAAPHLQLLELNSRDFHEHICLYPSATVLAKLAEIETYRDSPYSRELALGAGQLEFRMFDLSVLEHYRNDPRYHYETDSLWGRICVRDEFYQSNLMDERDQVLLKSFGFAYDDDMNRCVTAFVFYLSELSPEHQRIWAAKALHGSYRPHPDYFRTTILGEWGTRVPIFEAFVEELSLINEMTTLMRMPPLFRHTFKEDRPKEFNFMLRPTRAEFDRFVQMLDHMMSDNLNKDFFKGQIATEEEEERDDGKILVRQLGTIRLLEQWLTAKFHPKDPSELNKIFAAFRKVRNLRQKPAHAANPDSFAQEHFKNQRELMTQAYDAVRLIRQAFANHPYVKRNPPSIGKELFDGLIWDY
jgi:hypothetical protein